MIFQTITRTVLSQILTALRLHSAGKYFFVLYQEQLDQIGNQLRNVTSLD